MATTSARVRCPHCSKSFKIPDRSLLGRTGKCSACAQKFTLVEDTGDPAASDTATAQKTTPAAPAPTPAAKPAPKPAAPKPAPAAEKPPAAPPTSPAKAPTPPAKVPVPRAEAPPPVKKSPSSVPTKPAPEPAPAKPARVVAEEPPFGLNAKWVPDGAATTVVASATAVAAAVAVDASNPFGAPDEEFAAPAPPRGRKPSAVATSDEEPARPRRKKRRTPLIAAAAAVILIGGGLAAIAFTRGGGTTGTGANTTSANIATNTNAVPTGPTAYTREMLKGNLALLEAFRPTHGPPISMQFVPNGVNFVVHLRPSELWANDHAAAEFRGSLTDGVTAWLDAKIKELCHRDPSRVSEATFAFVLGAFGTQPTSTQVVRLTEPDKMSALLEEFRGKPLKEDLKPLVTIAPPNAYVLVDTRTFSVSPSDTADELEESLAAPNGYVSKNVAELLKQTDRDRLLTVVAEMQDFRRHVDTLFVESARPTIHAIVDWLGDDVDAIAWSLHRGQTLHSEIILRPKPGITAKALEASIDQKLKSLPEAVMRSVKGTRPAAKGFREIIGRYPAMLEAVVESTLLRPEGRDLHALTVLPAKAAPNLALGTLLTWDELRRTPGGAGASSVATAAAGNEKVGDKLKKELLAEFSRMPLEQVVKYIGDETGVDFSVDGEALKMTGYTRNMPQTMSLGKVPATKALKAMLDVPNQKDLAIFVDEATGKAVMSTRPYLKAKGKTEFKIE